MAVTAVAFVARHNAADIVVGRAQVQAQPFPAARGAARLATGESQAAVAQTYNVGPGDRV
jgi:protein involved in polysaccharide export with SLBB domain